MRMKLSTIGAVSAAFALCAAAGAQTTPTAPLGVGLRLGLIFPTNETTNDDTGSGFFGFGADYDLSYKGPSLTGFRSSARISLDYYGRSDYSNIPVLLNYVGTKGRFSVFGGVGVAFTSTPGDDKTSFGYQVGVGYDLPSTSSTPIFLQAKFMGSDQSKVNGVGVYAGIKF